MSNLPKETIERIEADALAYAKMIPDCLPHIAYRRGATSEAEKAQPVIDAMEELLNKLPNGIKLISYFAKEQVIKAREELAKYREVGNANT
jgi:hypothetical protein